MITATVPLIHSLRLVELNALSPHSELNALSPHSRIRCARGLTGWDTIKAHMPESEIGNLIIELRSATAGVGTFTYTHDHLAELTGRLADQVMQSRKDEAA